MCLHVGTVYNPQTHFQIAAQPNKTKTTETTQPENPVGSVSVCWLCCVGGGDTQISHRPHHSLRPLTQMMEAALGLRCRNSSSFAATNNNNNAGLLVHRLRRHHHHQLVIKNPNPHFRFNRVARITQSCSTNSIAIPPHLTNKIKASPDNLDEWMNHSVAEIVRHIGEAPFLIHLTTTSNNALELKRETAAEGSWSSSKRRWGEGCPVPDGVILVQRLDRQEDDQNGETKVWGILVQGKGLDTAACYILKTCRVGSSFGFCTHFCLVKAKCFGDNAELQLEKSWNGIHV